MTDPKFDVELEARDAIPALYYESTRAEAIDLLIIFGRKCFAAGAESERVKAALDLAVRFGGIDGDHHKAWVIDQMVRVLAADRYDQLVRDARAGEDGPETYEWDEGIAP